MTNGGKAQDLINKNREDPAVNLFTGQILFRLIQKIPKFLSFTAKIVITQPAYTNLSDDESHLIGHPEWGDNLLIDIM